MMIGGIGSSYYDMTQMAGTRSRPCPADMFNETDEDGSGGLDEAELSDLATMISDMTGEDVDAEGLLAQYDEDGDGQLSEAETQALMDDHRPEGPPPGGMMGMQPPPPDLSQIFSDADADENGSLDEEEIDDIASMISNATGEEKTVEGMISEFDEDGDGVLNEEEALAALEANRPEGPLPPPEETDAQPAAVSWAQANGVESYMMMASLAMDQDPSMDVLSMAGRASTDPSYFVNTIV